jgi:Domain of unknown function (DUF1707)
MNDGAIRASDAEREQAAAELREHFADGRLDEDELAKRLEAVYAARTRKELLAVHEDLPQLPLSPDARRAELAERQAHLRRRLLQQAGGSCAPFLLCVVIWAASGAQGAFWPAFLLIAPVLFVGRNLWALYGPEPQLDRVHAELERSHHRHGRGRDGSERRMGPPSRPRGLP